MAASSEAKMCCWFRYSVIRLDWPNCHSVGFFGFSLSFDTTGMVGKTTNLNYFVGGMGKAFLRGIDVETILSGSTIPETVFIMLQLTFVIITPPLITEVFRNR